MTDLTEQVRVLKEALMMALRCDVESDLSSTAQIRALIQAKAPLATDKPA